MLARPNQPDESESGSAGDAVPTTDPTKDTNKGSSVTAGTKTPAKEIKTPDLEAPGEVPDLVRSVSLQTLPGLYSPPFYVPLSYACLPGDVIVLEVLIDTDLVKKLRIFSKTKFCRLADSRLVYEHLDLPELVTYRPDALNRHSVNIYNAVISVWIVRQDDFHSRRTFREIKRFSLVAQDYPLEFKHPFARPRRRDVQISRTCLSWEAEMLLFVDVEPSLQCVHDGGKESKCS